MDPLIGKFLHWRYRIQSLLGRQTGRRTFLASELWTQTNVVIKLLLFGADCTWEDLKLFEREAEVLKSLQHSAIPQYLDFFEVETKQGKGFALVQTYIEARSLQDWVEAGRTFSEEDLKEIAKALLGILDYLHCRQPSVVHRDLKPSNILLGDRSGHQLGQIYLVDFGSVQTVVHGGTRTIVGTYGYMPPEQFGGQTTPASDLYALGATLIYLVTGQHPDQLPQREMRILFEHHVNLSPSMVDWLKWLTEPSLERRLNSVKQALAALETPITRLGVPAKSIGTGLKVAQTEQELEILIPLSNRHFIHLCSLAFYLLASFTCTTLCGALFFGVVSSLVSKDFFGSMLALIFAMTFAIPSLGSSLESWYAVCLLFGQRLRITPQKVIIFYELFGARCFRVPITQTVDLQQISRIEYTPSPTLGSIGFFRSPHIDIWVGKKRLIVGFDREYDRDLDRLADAEFRWIERALKDARQAAIYERVF